MKTYNNRYRVYCFLLDDDLNDISDWMISFSNLKSAYEYIESVMSKDTKWVVEISHLEDDGYWYLIGVIKNYKEN